jgi:hypothetical protein
MTKARDTQQGHRITEAQDIQRISGYLDIRDLLCTLPPLVLSHRRVLPGSCDSRHGGGYDFPGVIRSHRSGPFRPLKDDSLSAQSVFPTNLVGLALPLSRLDHLRCGSVNSIPANVIKHLFHLFSRSWISLATE